ncbi:hypothetical protein RYX36_030205 [Vicia faba]
MGSRTEYDGSGIWLRKPTVHGRRWSEKAAPVEAAGTKERVVRSCDATTRWKYKLDEMGGFGWHFDESVDGGYG